MHARMRLPLIAALLLASASFAGYGAAGSATAAGGARQAGKAASAGSGPSIKRFDLGGYVIVTAYSLGRNQGNTFRQTYGPTTVQGVPIKGPFVGTKFPREDYVAMPIGNHELFVAWQDSKSHALVDVFVMNFVTHVVFDYAPGSTHPESSGRVVVEKRGTHRLP